MRKIPSFPPLDKRKRKTTIKNIHGKSVSYTIIDEIAHTQSNYPEKTICLQKLQFDDGRMEFRLCYYMIGKKPRMRGKWTYAQSAVMIPPKDIRVLLAKAKKRGFF